MTKSVIHIVLGTKGGVGKTTLACHLADYLAGQHVPHLLVDADDENQSFHRFFPDAMPVSPRNVRSVDSVVAMAESGDHRIVLVDLRAGSGDEMLRWFEDVPFDELRETVRFVGWGCITTDPDSVVVLLRWAASLGDHLQYVVVKNEKDGKEMDALEHTKEGAEFLKKRLPQEVRIPLLAPTSVVVDLNKNNLSLGSALTLKEKIPGLTDTMMRSRLRRYQRGIFDQFDRLAEVIFP
ncbi:AAA family ATPase [Methylacidimicrobium sp. AP8]|uniref:nucleotide-binding protein n=1 Tax=Methylacidimicrobium sp. AP8 TaxID=2730359 RepID=UPI001F208C9F|nr:AAA family ATPase [Methylacidimicrobium sp. AP8]